MKNIIFLFYDGELEVYLDQSSLKYFISEINKVIESEYHSIDILNIKGLSNDYTINSIKVKLEHSVNPDYFCIEYLDTFLLFTFSVKSVYSFLRVLNHLADKLLTKSIDHEHFFSGEYGGDDLADYGTNPDSTVVKMMTIRVAHNIESVI